MNRTSKAILALLALGFLGGGVFLLSKPRSGPPVTVKLRITVTPQEQSDFVAGQLNSARFKYFSAKQAGVTPALAQRLSVKPVPNSALLEAQVHLLTKDDAQKYVAGFVETLQTLCGTQAQVALTQQSIR
jgi:hypothetical protein